jgi:hypothetical protein
MVVSAKAHFKDAEAGVDMLDVSLDRASGMDALKDQVVQSSGPAMAAEISPMDSFFDNFAKSASPSETNTTKQQSNLQQQFSSVLSANRPIWQPTVKLDNSRVATNAVQNRQEGDAKIADANQKMADMRSEIQDITKKMDQPDAKGGQDNQMGGAPQGSMLGGLGGGLVRDAMISGGLTAIGMPFAAAAVGAASMAVAVTGRGTFGVANSGEFSASKTDRKGRTVDAGYARSEAAPAVQSGPAAPQTSAVWNKLANGPGFGAAPRSRTDEASADLAGQSLTGIAALKLAENSPAMMAYKSQRMDGEAVHKIHEARIAKGLVADEPNLSRAQNIGVPEGMINRPMLSGLHM